MKSSTKKRSSQKGPAAPLPSTPKKIKTSVASPATPATNASKKGTASSSTSSSRDVSKPNSQHTSRGGLLPRTLPTQTLDDEPHRNPVGSSQGSPVPDRTPQPQFHNAGQQIETLYNIRGVLGDVGVSYHVHRLKVQPVPAGVLAAKGISAKQQEQLEFANELFETQANYLSNIQDMLKAIDRSRMKGNFNTPVTSSCVTVCTMENDIKERRGLLVEQTGPCAFTSVPLAEMVGHFVCVTFRIKTFIKYPDHPKVQCWIQSIEKLMELPRTDTEATPQFSPDPNNAMFAKEFK